MTSIEHCGFPTWTNWKRNSRPAALDHPVAVLAAAGKVALGAQARPAHVHRAGRRTADPRPDLARGRAHAEAVVLGPAGAAQVHHRLAHAVARQLGLRAVGVVDAQVGHEAPLVAGTQQQEPVGADPGVGRAERADPLRGQLEGQLALLHERVVVAQGLPLLEAHAAAL